MRQLLWAVLVGLLLTLLAGCDSGEDNNGNFPVPPLRSVLGPGQVVPATLAASGDGVGLVTVSDNRSVINVQLDTTGVTGITRAEIRLGAVDEEGSVLFTLFSSGTFPAVLTRELTLADFQPAPSEDIITFDDAIDAMAAGRTYFQVDSITFPNGALRGQIGPARIAGITLSGANEIPPSTTVATGSATLQFNAAQSAFTVQLNTLGLQNVVTVEIRLGGPAAEGPAIFRLFTANQGDFSNNLTRTLTAADLIPQPGIVNFDDAVNAILSGDTYLEVRTLQFQEGEIRGQITPGALVP